MNKVFLDKPLEGTLLDAVEWHHPFQSWSWLIWALLAVWELGAALWGTGNYVIELWLANVARGI